MGELVGERLQIMLTHAELRVIDTWRFGKRMPSRARQYGSYSSVGLLPRDLGKSWTAKGRRTSLFFLTTPPSSGPVSIWCSSQGPISFTAPFDRVMSGPET